MKPLLLTACTAFLLVGPFVEFGSAQCLGPSGGNQVCNPSVSKTTILGDGSDFSTATATIHIVAGNSGGGAIFAPNGNVGASMTSCSSGPVVSGPYGLECDVYAQGPADVPVMFSFNGTNGSTSNASGAITIGIPCGGCWQTFNLTIIGTGNSNPSEPPQNDPNGPCPSCNGASGGPPINFLNGDTYIPQTDYSLPGLGGGLTLTRTWNSLWSLMNPPEQSGIFGDSWRSNFEERIQDLGSGTIKYWKGNGSSLFYAFNSLTGNYDLTAPLDEQITLAYNSTTSQWTVTEQNGTQHIFNFSGYLTSVVDANGNTTTISVDAANQNRIASVTDPAGRVLTFNYANGTFPRLCTSITDSVGTFSNYQYDSSGRLTQVSYPDGSQYNFQFNDPNSNTLISKVTDSQAKVIEAHTYDSQRRGLTAQLANDANGNAVGKVTVSYSGGGLAANQVYVQNSFGYGHGARLTISNRGQRHYLIAVANGAEVCSTCNFQTNTNFGLSDTGHAIFSQDAGGGLSGYSYDSQGNLAVKNVPTGSRNGPQNGYSTWNYTYNSFGEVLTATDPLATSPTDPNHTTTYTYDSHGNLLSVTTPSPDGGTTPGSLTQFAYNSNGTLGTITDPLNHVTTLTYYTSGLIHTIQDAQSNVTTYTYDGRGNRLTVQDPINGSSQPTTFTYDAMNRATSITYPSQTTSVQFHYDYRGRRDYVIDQNGNQTSYAYDDADRLISVTDAQSPTAGVTTYGYDTESNLTNIYDAKQNHTQFSYINGHQLRTVTFPTYYQETYRFDDNDNLINKTDRNGNLIRYISDYQNRLIQKTYPNYSQVNYTYDAAGRLTQVTDDSGTYSFGCDNMSRLTSAGTNYSFLSIGNKTVSYGYDAASNRTSMTDPQSLPTAYGYDTLNRLTSLAFNGQNPGFTFGYDGLSRRTSLTRPNGVNTTYGYDPVSRLLSILDKLGSTTLDGASYTYDNAGNRTSKTDLQANVTSNYGYDNIYQLLQVTQGASTTESYSYDAIGNRLSSLGVSPYSYNSSNELTSTPSTTYAYDYNGNTATKTDSTGTTSYAWDYDNRLKQVTLPGSGGTVSFKYDPFGRRAQKSFTQNSTTTTTNYLYDGANLLEEVDSSGNTLSRYTQGPGIDEPLAELRSGTTSYYQQDALNSVTSLSNSVGALVNTYRYDSYGKMAGATGSITNPFQFTGREIDTETTIYFYRSRYYDASVGRFISEDSIGFGGGNNFYRYVLNSPTTVIDPLGLAPNCSMTPAGLVCDSNYAVDYQIGVIQALFPGSTPQGGSLVVHMPCDDVRKVLENSGYYTGGPFTAGNWPTQNPFLFYDPLFHSGGSEYRNSSGFHFRMSYGKKCDKDCTLDEFHIDEHNPMFDPWGHFINDLLPNLLPKRIFIGGPILPIW